jgi:limonene-1,2-epoxide hydrolase
MEWDDYKRLCDSPRTFSRWMLEQCVELLASETELRDALIRSMCAAPLDRPIDHRGDPRTDMFEVVLVPEEARAIHGIIEAAVREGRTTGSTKSRGLGGFEEAWREYVVYVELNEGQLLRGGAMGNASKVVTSLVDAFNASDMARIMSHFTEESVYHNIPTAPVTGNKAIREVIENFMGMSSKVDWEVQHLVEGSNGVVLTERVDRFMINGKWIALPVMGTFEVANGKIKAWRDYFDMNQFQSQLAG